MHGFLFTGHPGREAIPDSVLRFTPVPVDKSIEPWNMALNRFMSPMLAIEIAASTLNPATDASTRACDAWLIKSANSSVNVKVMASI
jgi:hypothetical protein